MARSAIHRHHEPHAQRVVGPPPLPNDWPPPPPPPPPPPQPIAAGSLSLSARSVVYSLHRSFLRAFNRSFDCAFFPRPPPVPPPRRRRLSICYRQVTLHCNRAACHLKLGNLDKVVSDTTTAVKVDKKATKALFRRAQAYEQLGRHEDACRDLYVIYHSFTCNYSAVLKRTVPSCARFCKVLRSLSQLQINTMSVHN